MMLYPLYRAATTNERVREELGRIIAEEQDHRIRIEEDCLLLLAEANVADLDAADAIESACFDELWTAFEIELGLAQRA